MVAAGKGIRVKERRGTQRRAINRVAQYHCGIGALPRSCMVTNISDTGARLYCETDVPDAFTLSLSLSGEDVNVRRECRVVWRLGGELGVEFTDRSAR